MTKQGIRSISLSSWLLRKIPSAGMWEPEPGSVSVEMARQCPRGEVWAIEKKDEAVELLEENRRKFALDNLTIVPGLAPEALKELPAPTHVFIGGSSGNLICISWRRLLRKIRGCGLSSMRSRWKPWQKLWKL